MTKDRMYSKLDLLLELLIFIFARAHFATYLHCHDMLFVYLYLYQCYESNTHTNYNKNTWFL